MRFACDINPAKKPYVLTYSAGYFWDAIVSYGGPRRTPGEAVAALEEGIQIMRALWNPSSRPVSFAGTYLLST
jgi:alkanesulfonate monooxygenase SsuD/methylene tetrahydromethanopterin reductase-like flavin-dependent oxidoreductase (luciferase family)